MLDFSCEQTIHMKWQALFSLKKYKIKKNKGYHTHDEIRR